MIKIKRSALALSSCSLSVKKKPQILKTFYYLSILSLYFIFGCTKSSIAPEPVFKSTYDLCYTKSAGNSWEIYLNTIKGDIPQNISNSGFEDNENLWSPNGKYIIYGHHTENFTRIYRFNLESNETENLTTGYYYGTSPIWTPDSKHILFTYNNINDDLKTYSMKADGSEMKKVLDFEARIYFYPDGYNFIYHSKRFDATEFNIYLTNLDRTYNELILDTRTISTDTLTLYDLNPYNNDLLVLPSNFLTPAKSILTFNIFTGKIDTLLKADAGYGLSCPRYSHDFRKIVYYENDKDKNYSLYIYDIPSKQKIFLCNLPGSDGYPNYVSPVFSPDDKYVAFVKNVALSKYWFQWKPYLYIVEIRSKEVRFIDEAYSPSWNPQKRY